MSKKRILLVDDEVELVEMVKMRLEANDYDVICAYDGQEAVKAARKEIPDLIILDVMIPKLDGYKVCKTLKTDAKCKNIPIALFTARAQESDKKTGKEAGADAYIIKPFEPQTLLSTVKQLLKEQ